jgi:hypothetical protein
MGDAIRFLGYALFSASLALGVRVMAAETARVVETRSMSGEQLSGTQGATHDLALHLFTFQGARWLSGDIVMAVWEAMRVLEQCGVVLAGAELRLLDAPSRFHVYSTPVSRELLSGMAVIKPAIFFVEDTRNQPAYDAETVGQGNSATRPELMNTVWIAYGARDLPLALAHELVHLLSDSGDHSNEPGNLMQPESSPENTRLSDAQCQRLRTRGEANGLLKRR